MKKLIIIGSGIYTSSLKLYRDNSTDVVFTETNSTKGWINLNSFCQRHAPKVIDDGLIIEDVTTLGAQGVSGGIGSVFSRLAVQADSCMASGGYQARSSGRVRHIDDPTGSGRSSALPKDPSTRPVAGLSQVAHPCTTPAG